MSNWLEKMDARKTDLPYLDSNGVPLNQDFNHGSVYQKRKRKHMMSSNKNTKKKIHRPADVSDWKVLFLFCCWFV